MKNIRLMASTVFCVSALALSACGGGDAPAGTAAPSATTAATTGAPATSSAPAAAAASDKEICNAAVKATTAFGEKLAESLKAGKELTSADIQALLNAMATDLSVAEGGTSDVAKSAQVMVAELKKVAASADLATAEDSPEYQKAGTELDAACKAAGVEINFA